MPNRIKAQPTAVPILLAAGRGTRMGGPKGLLSWDGQSLLGRLQEMYRNTSAAECLVVAAAGSGVEPLARQLGLHTVLNPEPERGPLSSIWCALDALAVKNTGAILVHPVDCPVLEPSVPECLLEAWRNQNASMVVPTWQGRRGHPLLVSAQHFDTIRQLDLDVGLRQLLWQAPRDVCEIPVETPEIRKNLNTPQDLESFLQQFPGLHRPKATRHHPETSR